MAQSISTLRWGIEIRMSDRAQIVLPHAVGARTLVQLNYSSYLVVKGSELGSKVRIIAYFLVLKLTSGE